MHLKAIRHRSAAHVHRSADQVNFIATAAFTKVKVNKAEEPCSEVIYEPFCRDV